MIGLKLAILQQSVSYAMMFLNWNQAQPLTENFGLEWVTVSMHDSATRVILPSANFDYPPDVNSVAILINRANTTYTVTNHFIDYTTGDRFGLTSEPYDYTLLYNAKHPPPSPTPTPPATKSKPSKSKLSNARATPTPRGSSKAKRK